MSGPLPGHGEYVPVRPPGAPDLPPGAWPAHQPWYGPMYGPMPQVTVEAVRVPGVLRASAWLWLSGSLLYVAGWVVAAFVDVPFVAADMAGDPEVGSVSEARPAAIVLFVMAIGVALVVGVVQSVLGFLLWRRQNWARILLAVLGGIMLLVLMADAGIGAAWRSDAPAGVGDPWVGYTVVASLAAIQFGATVAAIVTMFLRSSNAFFAGGRGG